jgi:tRNA(Ile)-lysidine synthase
MASPLVLNQESFFEQLRACQLGHQCIKNYVVSCSGGLDSMVLLHLMSSLKPLLLSNQVNISAIYVNHNLSQFSEQWGLFCQSICQTYNIPLQIISVNAKPKPRQSPEEASRDARYSAIKEIIVPSDCLLTAHHQNDQAETLLLHLLRGSGPKGLAAMPACRDFYHATLARPLLNFSRNKIKNYALKHQLQWVEDESNTDQNFKRNFIRHSIFPKLQQQWTGFETTLFRASQLQQEAVEILAEVAEQDLSICELDVESEQKSNHWFCEPMLDRSKLQTLSPARIKNCIQFWLKKNKVAALNSNLLSQVIEEFINRQPTAKIKINWKSKQQQFQLHYFQNRIFLCTVISTHTKSCVLWDYKKHKQISFGENQLQVVFSLAQLDQAQLDCDCLKGNVLVSFRQGGECYQKNQHSQHYSLKKWFQEQSVPPWIRSQIPLFYKGEQLIQIGNTIVNSDYLAVKGKPALSFSINKQTAISLDNNK